MCERKYFAKVSVTIDLCQRKIARENAPYNTAKEIFVGDVTTANASCIYNTAKEIFVGDVTTAKASCALHFIRKLCGRCDNS